MSLNIQVLLLISKKFKQLKIGFGALTVKSLKFWALLYSSDDEIYIKEINHIFKYHITYKLLVFATVRLYMSIIITFH